MQATVKDAVIIGKFQKQLEAEAAATYQTWVDDQTQARSIVDNTLHLLVSFLEELDKLGFAVEIIFDLGARYANYRFTVIGIQNKTNKPVKVAYGDISIYPSVDELKPVIHFSGKTYAYYFEIGVEPHYNDRRYTRYGTDMDHHFFSKHTLDSIAKGLVSPIREVPVEEPQPVEKKSTFFSEFWSGLMKLLS